MPALDSLPIYTVCRPDVQCNTLWHMSYYLDIFGLFAYLYRILEMLLEQRWGNERRLWLLFPAERHWKKINNKTLGEIERCQSGAGGGWSRCWCRWCLFTISSYRILNKHMCCLTYRPVTFNLSFDKVQSNSLQLSFAVLLFQSLLKCVYIEARYKRPIKTSQQAVSLA